LDEGNLLSHLFTNHTGKYSDKWSSYLDVYWNLLAPIRNNEIDVFEIGIQNGGSLEIWAKFFPNAKTLIGFDNDPKCKDLEFEDPRIKVFVDDASEPKAGTLVKETSSNLGLVIDDGSHISKDIIRSFLIFFPQLNPGGLYVIEDLHASYWSDWQGGISHPESSMQFLKLLADIVNFDHWGINSPRTELFDLIPATDGLLLESTLSEVESVLFLDSVCVIRKKSGKSTGLGLRVGSGSQAIVFEGVKESIGKPSTPPNQEGSALANARDLNLGQSQIYKSRNNDLLIENSELRDQLKFHRESIQALQGTLSWRITKPLRNIRNLLAKAVNSLKTRR
jgi:hypothetical protein